MFDEVTFPLPLSRGADGGCVFSCDVVTLRSGFERRNSGWSLPLRRYKAGAGLRTIDQVLEALKFFEERGGRLKGFRFLDWLDYKSCPITQEVTPEDQFLGTGNGSNDQFQLVKVYKDSLATSSPRLIQKPVDVMVAVNGKERAFHVDKTTGIVTLNTRPSRGNRVTAGFTFDVPVRFTKDEFVVNVEMFHLGEVPVLDVQEIRL